MRTNLEKQFPSSDGAKLFAELVNWDGEVARLKRTKDGKVFDLLRAKLSEADAELLDEAAEKIQSMANVSGKANDRNNKFVGFPDPSEETWALAQRLAKHEMLWQCVTQQVWEVRGAACRVISLNPQRFVVEKPGSGLVIGNYVVIRLLPPEGTSLTAGATGLVLVRGGNKTDGKITKKEIAQKGIPFVPICVKEDLVSCKMEEIGVTKLLVFTINLRQTRN